MSPTICVARRFKRFETVAIAWTIAGALHLEQVVQ